MGASSFIACVRFCSWPCAVCKMLGGSDETVDVDETSFTTKRRVDRLLALKNPSWYGGNSRDALGKSTLYWQMSSNLLSLSRLPPRRLWQHVCWRTQPRDSNVP